MRFRNRIQLCFFALTTVSFACWAQQSSSQAAPSSTAVELHSNQADNSKNNMRDRNGATLTPQSQSNNASDRQLLASVRHSIVNDKSISTMAHNVKIVVQGSLITLRGPVKNQDEKARIEKLVQQTAGVSKIDNQLEVKTN